MTEEPAVGVIGGSGLYAMEGFSEIERVQLSTPFGEPSDAFIVGRFQGLKTVFLPRHGVGHRIAPSEINFRANIWGMKRLGVSRILSISAVGSMREEIAPGDFVLVDQFIDRTRHRQDSFFGSGVVAHVMFADPICGELSGRLERASQQLDLKLHPKGTYLCMEGPQFSTRAESRMYRSWGVDVIGMTNLQEARLSREAEICYSSVAMSTDYDSWREGEEDVSVEAILEVMGRNVGKAQELIRLTLPLLGDERGCACQNALQYAILTDQASIPQEARDRLGLLIEKYLHA